MTQYKSFLLHAFTYFCGKLMKMKLGVLVANTRSAEPMPIKRRYLFDFVYYV